MAGSTNFFVKNGLTVNNQTIISASNGQINVGSNVVLTNISLSIGNTSANLVSNSLVTTIANSTVTTIYGVGGANVGANVQLTSVALLIGNSVANSIANSIVVSVSNSTSSANIIPTGFIVGTTVVNSSVFFTGNSTVNTTANSTVDYYSNSTVTSSFGTAGANIGANVNLSTTGISIGNSTVNTVANSTALTCNGTITDSASDVRLVPINSQTSAYVLAASDKGKTISITTGGVTVNGALLAAGFICTIFNNSGSNQTITSGTGATVYLAGTATTGNRTLAQRGLATVVCVAANTFAISGAGLT